MKTRSVRVFLASPGDVELERQLFYELLPKLRLAKGIKFVPTGYELAPASVGVRPQDVINQAVDSCDVFVALFHRRWGQPAQDSAVAESYTEEEFNRALSRFGATGEPRMMCFFKNLDVGALADPGPQLTKVLEFRRRLERSGSVLYRTFGTELDFGSELERHLEDYISGPPPGAQLPQRKVLLPVLADDGPDLNRNRDLALAAQASRAANAGRMEEAETLFARLSQTSVTVSALDVAKEFFDQVTNLPASQAVLDRKLALLRDRRLAAQEYMATLMTPNWVDAMIRERLTVTPPNERRAMEATLRAAFGPRFEEMLLEVMSQHFTFGELRALAKFYSGEGATIMSKMSSFMGTVLPQSLEKLDAIVGADLQANDDEISSQAE